jgi:hypothetical protein
MVEKRVFHHKEWRNKARVVKDLLELLGILILWLKDIDFCEGIGLVICWRRRKKRNGRYQRSRKPAVLRPKRERGNLPGTANYAAE